MAISYAMSAKLKYFVYIIYRPDSYWCLLPSQKLDWLKSLVTGSLHISSSDFL